MIPKHSNRELIYLTLILILVLGFYFQLKAAQLDLKEYSEAYKECIENKQFYNNINSTSEYIDISKINISYEGK